MLGFCLALMACSDTGPTAIAGSLGGIKPQAHYAVSLYIAQSDVSIPPDILISPRSDMCALLQKGQFVRNTDIVDIQLYANNTLGEIPTSTGVFSVVEIPNQPSNPNLFSMVEAGVTGDANVCFDVPLSQGVSGSVTITDLGDSTTPTVGQFDAKFSDGELAGYFSALPCVLDVEAALGTVTCD